MNMLLVTLPLVVQLMIPPGDGPAWHHQLSQKGIEVWTAQGAEGEGTWGRAEGPIPAAPAALLEHLVDFDHMVGQIPRLAKVRVLSREPGEVVAWFYFDLPWPISDRDYTARYRWSSEPGGDLVVTIDDANAEGPAPARAVRVKQLHGEFRVRPAEQEGDSQLRFTYHADFGGWLPGSVKSAISWKQPLYTVQGIRDFMARSRADVAND